jgi:hypothetical protein
VSDEIIFNHMASKDKTWCLWRVPLITSHPAA